MSAIDPASAIRPGWWTDDTYLHLAALEDGALPGRGLLESEQNHPTLPVLESLIRAVWWLGKTGGGEERAETSAEALRVVEHHAVAAARAARRSLSFLIDRTMDDEEAEFERSCERDENYGTPPARLTDATFTVRLPGFSGDTVSGRIHVSGEGMLTVQGCGPLADLDLLGRLGAREVIDAIEHLVTRQAERPLPGPTSTAPADS
ncbi:hypothetical protein [Streptomyces sp. NPDC048581]|uniref:hypothetical protein n=1 Tax=unclassified Streptomyces TaxID=2593676 RepID=UPI003722F037